MGDERSVRILFPDLTHKGKVYGVGEIEPEPTSFLIDAAKTKEKMFHRDSNRYIRICRFVSKEEEDVFEFDEEEYKPSKKPVVNEDKVEMDDLNEKGLSELKALAMSMGLKRSVAKNVKSRESLRTIIRVLRKI